MVKNKEIVPINSTFLSF